MSSWKRSMTCICGQEIKLDFLGKNFKKHITENEVHLKYLRKLWKKKQKQGKPPLFFQSTKKKLNSELDAVRKELEYEMSQLFGS